MMHGINSSYAKQSRLERTYAISSEDKTYDRITTEINSNSSCEDYEKWIAKLNSETARWSFAICAFLIIIVTLVLNILVIIRLKFKSKHKYFTKFFLTSMAMADILVGSAIIPFTIYGLFTSNRDLFGDLTCEIFNSLDVMFSTSSIFHLSALAFERFIALCYPLSYNRICDWKTRTSLCLLCWALPAVLSFGTILPKIHEISVEYIVECFKIVSESCTFVVNLQWAFVSSTISMFIPMVLILCFNICVCLSVRKHGRMRKSMIHNSVEVTYSQRSTRSMVTKETKVAMTISLMTGVFIACWLPFFIYNIVSSFLLYKISGTVFLVCTFLGYANSAANPLVFLISDLRK